jgi:hypothetical protein
MYVCLGDQRGDVQWLVWLVVDCEAKQVGKQLKKKNHHRKMQAELEGMTHLLVILTQRVGGFQ